MGVNRDARTPGDDPLMPRRAKCSRYAFAFRAATLAKFGLHAGIDLAHSPGTTAIYLQVGSAWFRP